MIPALVITLFVILLFATSIRIISPNERGVIVRLGRALRRSVGPGLVFLVPLIDRLPRVPAEPFSVSLPPQSAITKDEIPIQLQASLQAKLVEPWKALDVKDWRVTVMSQLQLLMKDRLEDLDFDKLAEVFPGWVASIRKELGNQALEFGVEVTDLQISNLSPRTKPS